LVLELSHIAHRRCRKV